MQSLDNLCANAIRVVSADAIQRANSGHPGMVMGAAPMGYALYSKHMIIDPKHPDWQNRDRFVLSAGHGSMLLYSLLHMFGFGLTMEDLPRPGIPNTAMQLVLRPPPGRWAKGYVWQLVWQWRKPIWPPNSTKRASRL